MCKTLYRPISKLPFCQLPPPRHPDFGRVAVNQRSQQYSAHHRPRHQRCTMAAQDAKRQSSPSSVKPLYSSNPKTQYLILYNFVSALLWLVVLGRVLILIPLVGFGRVYGGVGQFTKWTQTAALLEVVHAATGEFRTWKMKANAHGSDPGFIYIYRTRARAHWHDCHASS